MYDWRVLRLTGGYPVLEQCPYCPQFVPKYLGGLYLWSSSRGMFLARCDDEPLSEFQFHDAAEQDGFQIDSVRRLVGVGLKLAQRIAQSVKHGAAGLKAHKGSSCPHSGDVPWLLCSEAFGLRAKQLAALLGGGGEADGGQSIRDRWPSQILVARLETPREQ
jgi:hypothetical protein